jgi:hypothetical protein
MFPTVPGTQDASEESRDDNVTVEKEVQSQKDPQAQSTTEPKRPSHKCAVAARVAKWKVGTKVATTAGDNEIYKQLTKTRMGWVQGTLVRFEKGKDQCYIIQWNADPASTNAVDEVEMTILTQHYKGCDQRRLLDVFVSEWRSYGLFMNRSPQMHWKLKTLT